MNFRKLFFYFAVASLSALTNIQAAGRDTLVQDTNDDNRALIYADGSLTGMAPIALIGRLKALWGEEHTVLIREIVKASSPEQRLTILRTHKELIRKFSGVSANFNNLIRPGIAPRRPRGGAPAKAAEETHMKGGILRGLFDNVDEEDEDLKRNADAREAREGRAATSIQSGWRGMKGRRTAAERRREMTDEMAAMDADFADVTESYRDRARKAADDYDRFGPAEEEYSQAKKDWQRSHNTKLKGWHDRMLKDLKKHFPNQVARDRKYKK